MIIMVIPNVDIDYFSVLIAGISGMVIGALWYSPVLFGKIWMKLSGMDSAKINSVKKIGMGLTYFLAFIGSLIMACVLVHFMAYMVIDNFVDTVQLVFWSWIGFIAPVTLSVVLWEGKSWKLWFLNNSYYLISLIVMSVVLLNI